MKEDSGAANKKCKKRKLEEDSDDESMVDWIQEVGAVEIVQLATVAKFGRYKQQTNYLH